ncbi:YciI family protein [Ideonella sp. BN130291]|uniref:YciI family protein n=1 Tax=Ideonella sp. BN130291 TaxID=3112940 RepID=UPI002E2722F4|nr:YciI family protein [Ideonella sp. BN130291]
MPYMLLIMEPTGQRRTRNGAEGHEVYDRMLRFGAELKSRGQLLAMESLKMAEATRVQVRQGERRFVDGPFSEAKELVGGFFLVDVPTREQALALAAECPAAEWCTVEVRSLGPCYEDA